MPQYCCIRLLQEMRIGLLFERYGWFRNFPSVGRIWRLLVGIFVYYGVFSDFFEYRGTVEFV